jgi:transposase
MERYVVAGIDVHKKMLAVVVAEVKVGELEFQHRRFGTTPSQLRNLAEWLREQEVAEAVMESTAQYWRPVWLELEGGCELHLAQARSNGARRGRKSDFRDAERLVRRFIADELVLSFVPDEEQRGWRWLTRTRYSLVRERNRVQNQVEGLLEDAQIKLSSKITDLFGASGRRILQALADTPGGELELEKLARLGDERLRASQEELQDALDGKWLPRHRLLLGMHLRRLHLLDQQIEELYREIGQALQAHQEAVARLSEAPGFGPDSAMQVIAEVGPTAATFPSPEELSSWVGCCPGQQESAGKSSSEQSPKGNRPMRRLLDQAAQAAVKKKGSFFQQLYRRLLPKLGEQKAIWAVAHRLCRLVWMILHLGVSYVEKGALTSDPKTVKRRQRRIAADFRKLGFIVTFTRLTPSQGSGLTTGIRA